MKRLATFALLSLIAASLAGCGSDRRQEDELMRRVAQADEAAKKAEAAATRAEDAAKRATGGSEVPETVYEEAPETDESIGEAVDAEPADG